ncbi:MAG: class 3 adenylate cyclase [Candidatus Azotimanducaceae bacterium]|jgi:adenylate cyclase
MVHNNENLFQYLESLIEKGTDPIDSEELVWQRYGKTVAVMVLDSSGFSRVSEAHGILHFLSRLMLMRRVVKPIIEANNPLDFHFEADNVFAVFEQPDEAIRTAVMCHEAVFENKVMLTEIEPFQLCIGIGYGAMLYSETLEGYFGEEMNLASKLGEDTADGGETLITERAYASASVDLVQLFEQRTASISGLAFPYYRRQFSGNK